MRELCTHIETGCSVETLGQFPTIEAEIGRVAGLKMLLAEAEENGFGTAVDEFVVGAGNLAKNPEPEIAETVAQNQEQVRLESPSGHTHALRGVLSLFARFAS